MTASDPDSSAPNAWTWLSFDVSSYSEDELLRAAHRVADRAYVKVERLDVGGYRVGLRQRGTLTNMDAVAGDLANFAIDERLRSKLRADTEPIRRLIIAQAFSKLNLLHPELDTDTADADPLRISEPDAR